MSYSKQKTLFLQHQKKAEEQRNLSSFTVHFGTGDELSFQNCKLEYSEEISSVRTAYFGNSSLSSDKFAGVINGRD